MVALTLFPNEQPGTLGMLLDWTGTAAVTATVTIAVNGTASVVRGCPVRLSSSQAVIWTNEFPLNTLLTLTTTSPEVTGSATVTTTVTATGTLGGYLKDPLQPANDVTLSNIKPLRSVCDATAGVGLVSFSDESFAAAGGKFDIVNATRPRGITQARKDASSKVALQTQQIADYLALDGLLGSGRQLLLQLPSTSWGFGADRYASDYILASDVTASRIDTQNYQATQRLWSIPYDLANAPANAPTNLLAGNGIAVRGIRFSDMNTAGSTYQTLNTAGNTYATWATGTW